MFPALTHVSILSSQAFRHLEPIRFASITFDMERSRLISNKTNDCVWSLSIKDRITKCGTVMSRDRERKELPLDEIKREKIMQQNGNWDCEPATQPKTRLKCHHKPNTCTNAKRVNLIFGFGLFFSLSFLLVLCVCVWSTKLIPNSGSCLFSAVDTYLLAKSYQNHLIELIGFVLRCHAYNFYTGTAFVQHQKACTKLSLWYTTKLETLYKVFGCCCCEFLCECALRAYNNWFH